MKNLFVFLFLLCGILTVAQVPEAREFNTGAASSLGMPDANWEVAEGDTLQPTSAFLPAIVVGNCNNLWVNSPTPEANWITYMHGGNCDHSQTHFDLYFRRRITLPPTDDCDRPIATVYCLNMDMNADNCVYEITVNGVQGYQYTGSLNPYQYGGVQNTVSVQLCDGWQAGQNTLMVHVKSNPTAVGLLAVGKPEVFVDTHFLGKDTVVCYEKTFLITSPDGDTRWFDNTTGATKMVDESGVYWATRVDAGGCEYSDTLSVRFNEGFYTPNAFSPNDDGYNDVFAPLFAQVLPTHYKLSIFDRWGSLVFQSSDVANGWDGNRMGKPCGTGVYVYYIETETGVCLGKSKGEVLLVR